MSNLALKTTCLAFVTAAFLACSLQAETALVPTGAVWKYLNTGTNLDTAWRAPDFDDSNWPGGPARLGFGEDGFGTLIYQPNLYVTTYYFRLAFETPGTAAFSNLVVRLLRDDGGIVYLNGTEIFRSNMPNGPVGYLTYAASIVNPPQETFFYATNVPLNLLNVGTNLLAVEIHQGNGTSSDLGFDLELAANVRPAPPLVRIAGPTNNAWFILPTNVVFIADATDLDNPVLAVEFFAGTKKIGQAGTEPFSITVSNLAVGTYPVTAVAWDSSARAGTSAPVMISVLGAPVVQTLIATGENWKYSDRGVDLGTNWIAPDFIDAIWPIGVAKFGAVDTHVTTIRVNYLTNLTTYFRHAFVATNAQSYTNLAFRVLRDDGVVVYLNGVELFRMNMLPGPVTFATPAASTVSSPYETYFFATNSSPAALQEGSNMLAVELHQMALGSDAGFDLELVAIGPPPAPPAPPVLGIARTESSLSISWSGAGFVLQQAGDPAGPWTNAPALLNSPLTIPTVGPGRFFRLFHP